MDFPSTVTPMATVDQRIESLKEQLKQAKAQKQRMEAQKRAADAKKERANDTRRKVLAGAMTLAKADQGPDERARLLRAMDAFLTRDDDRELFGLLPVQPQPPAA